MQLKCNSEISKNFIYGADDDNVPAVWFNDGTPVNVAKDVSCSSVDCYGHFKFSFFFFCFLLTVFPKSVTPRPNTIMMYSGLSLALLIITVVTVNYR